jgi:hypothetical protein
MNVEDYLIDPSGKNWPDLLSGWVPPLPASFVVWLVNRLGDVFVVFDDGAVHMLEVGTGVIACVADDPDDFARQIDLGDNANNWLMIPLVDQCVSAGVVLTPNQCYGYKVPPILGGEYAVENLEPTDLSVHYSLMADICRQAKDLPDGTKVTVAIER